MAQLSLRAGCNDFGGTLMEESISREAGADAGEYTPADEIRRLVQGVGRRPVERTTLYRKLEIPEESVTRASATDADRSGGRGGSREVLARAHPVS